MRLYFWSAIFSVLSVNELLASSINRQKSRHHKARLLFTILGYVDIRHRYFRALQCFQHHNVQGNYKDEKHILPVLRQSKPK